MNESKEFTAIIENLDPSARLIYDGCTHTRIEEGRRNRQFVIYEADISGKPYVHDLVTVTRLQVDLHDGLWAIIHSRSRDREAMVDYVPCEVFGHPVLAYLPLNSKLRWDAESQQLSFPIVLRTRSRFHLREPGVVYMESMETYYKEFGTPVFNA